MHTDWPGSFAAADGFTSQLRGRLRMRPPVPFFERRRHATVMTIASPISAAPPQSAQREEEEEEEQQREQREEREEPESPRPRPVDDDGSAAGPGRGCDS